MLAVAGIIVGVIGAFMMVAPDIGGRHNWSANPPWWGAIWPNRTEHLYDLLAIVGYTASY